MPGKGHRHDLSGCPVLVTENVEDYRKAIAEYVTSEDTALELGCHEGVTTEIIARYAKEVVGVDKSPHNLSKAKERYPHIDFYNLDAFDLRAVLKLHKRFTVIFVDISGNRPIGDVADVVEKYEKVFQPKLFVVKSFNLKRLVGQCTVYPEDVHGRLWRHNGVVNISEPPLSHPLMVTDADLLL